MKPTIKTDITGKEIWRIACPIMIGNLAQTIITFTDTAFLGHVGLIELSASMMAGMYYYVFTTLAMGFAVGIQIFVSRRYGEREYERIGEVFFHGAFFVLLLGILLFGILFLCSNTLLGCIIASPRILASAKEYIVFRQFGIIFVVFNYLFRSLYVGISNTKCISYSTLLMAVVNIVLDYALIFGRLGLPQLGVSGAAIASLTAEISAFAFFIIYTYIKVPASYALFKLHGIRPQLWWHIIKVAFPTMVQRLLSYGTWFMFFVFIEKMGELAIGISSLVRSVYMLLVIPVFAFASTANTLVSRIIGEGKVHQVGALVRKVVWNCILCSVPLVLVSALFPMQICSIYTQDMVMVHAAVPTIYVICVATIVSAIGMVIFESISGTGNTISALVIDFFMTSLYILYIAVVSNMWAIQWVWTAEWVYNICMGVVACVYIKKANWQRKVI